MIFQIPKQAFVSALVMKLQLYVQQVNGALEETSQSVLSGLPRILRDTQLLQQEALSLREKMVVVKQEIAKVRTLDFLRFNKYCVSLAILIGREHFRSQVEKDTASSMSTLERLDRIKTDLQAAKQSLHEADNWSVLANDVEEVILYLITVSFSLSIRKTQSVSLISFRNRFSNRETLKILQRNFSACKSLFRF